MKCVCEVMGGEGGGGEGAGISSNQPYHKALRASYSMTIIGYNDILLLVIASGSENK